MDVCKMKVYLGYVKSFGHDRVINALSKYMPATFERVELPDEADLIILHAIGRNQHITKQAQDIKAQGKQYAVIQYSLQSTRNPSPVDWIPLWVGAKVVWSYYDLNEYAPSFYHAPLAADPAVFYRQPTEKIYKVGTMGNCFRDECIGEVQLAAWLINERSIHVGKNFNSNPFVDYRQNLTDDQLREVYNSCIFFSCLRRKDGFEMPVVEALLCGVRPIVFDTPNYHQWFDGLAIFTPEASVKDTMNNVKRILRSTSVVTDEEIEETKRRFNWRNIITDFWSMCNA
jgi:hypothetical protein